MKYIHSVQVWAQHWVDGSGYGRCCLSPHKSCRAWDVQQEARQCLPSEFSHQLPIPTAPEVGETTCTHFPA